MADYFAALAARTLRPELSVQPRQRVRWEEAAEPIADGFPAIERRMTDGARPGVPDDGEPPRRSRRTPAAESGPPEKRLVEPQQVPARGKRKTADDHQDSRAATMSAPHPTVRALEPAVQESFGRAAAPAGASGKRAAVPGDRAGIVARPSGIERARPLPTRRSTRERESAVEPAIRIHIGRVDVRAVTAAPPASSPRVSRDSTRALMSLDEYVQKRDRGAS